MQTLMARPERRESDKLKAIKEMVDVNPREALHRLCEFLDERGPPAPLDKG